MKLLGLLFILFPSSIFSQTVLEPLSSERNELIIYPNPPSSIPHNNDYSVRVRKPNGEWHNLYEYLTYVDKAAGRGSVEESSFVAFDFSGSVEIEITSNIINPNTATIRPKSRNINYSINSNVIKISLSNPQKLSIELNNNRYANLHVFANKIITPPPASEITKTFYAGIQYPDYTKPNRFTVENGDVIYFEPGAIISGGIDIHNKSNVKLTGHGIIEQTGLEKRISTSPVSSGYESNLGIDIRNSNNVEINGLIINDVQHYGISIGQSNNISISDIKIFTQVLWGDGINIKASTDININDGFIRSNDDCVAIYPTRNQWNVGDTKNIYVSNLSLYPDTARPISIGWHGSRNFNNMDHIRNIHFDNIDVLELREPSSEYRAVIGISCGDENVCSDLYFNNFNVEDLSNGRLFDIRVVDNNYGAAQTNGFRVSNVKINNFKYNGYGESSSVIMGLNCMRYVEGVHFNDLYINGSLINNTSDYNFSTNSASYDITFQEKYNIDNSLLSSEYYIRLNNSRSLLQSRISSDNYSNTERGYYTYLGNNQYWKITNLNNGYYKIQKPNSNYYLTAGWEESYEYIGGRCDAFATTIKKQSNSMRQKWKIVKNSNGTYNIINAYTNALLGKSNNSNGSSNEYRAITFDPNYGNFSHEWIISPRRTSVNSNNIRNNTKVFPNPVINTINIQSFDSELKEYQITDYNGILVKKGYLEKQTDIDKLSLQNLDEGIYFIKITNNKGDKFVHKFIKSSFK